MFSVVRPLSKWRIASTVFISKSLHSNFSPFDFETSTNEFPIKNNREEMVLRFLTRKNYPELKCEHCSAVQIRPKPETCQSLGAGSTSATKAAVSDTLETKKTTSSDLVLQAHFGPTQTVSSEQSAFSRSSKNGNFQGQKPAMDLYKQQSSICVRSARKQERKILRLRLSLKGNKEREYRDPESSFCIKYPKLIADENHQTSNPEPFLTAEDFTIQENRCQRSRNIRMDWKRIFRRIRCAVAKKTGGAEKLSQVNVQSKSKSIQWKMNRNEKCQVRSTSIRDNQSLVDKPSGINLNSGDFVDVETQQIDNSFGNATPQSKTTEENQYSYSSNRPDTTLEVSSEQSGNHSTREELELVLSTESLPLLVSQAKQEDTDRRTSFQSPLSEDKIRYSRGESDCSVASISTRIQIQITEQLPPTVHSESGRQINMEESNHCSKERELNISNASQPALNRTQKPPSLKLYAKNGLLTLPLCFRDTTASPTHLTFDECSASTRIDLPYTPRQDVALKQHSKRRTKKADRSLVKPSVRGLKKTNDFFLKAPSCTRGTASLPLTLSSEHDNPKANAALSDVSNNRLKRNQQQRLHKTSLQSLEQLDEEPYLTGGSILALLSCHYDTTSAPLQHPVVDSTKQTRPSHVKPYVASHDTLRQKESVLDSDLMIPRHKLLSFASFSYASGDVPNILPEIKAPRKLAKGLNCIMHGGQIKNESLTSLTLGDSYSSISDPGSFAEGSQASLKSIEMSAHMQTKDTALRGMYSDLSSLSCVSSHMSSHGTLTSAEECEASRCVGAIVGGTGKKRLFQIAEELRIDPTELLQRLKGGEDIRVLIRDELLRRVGSQ